MSDIRFPRVEVLSVRPRQDGGEQVQLRFLEGAPPVQKPRCVYGRLYRTNLEVPLLEAVVEGREVSARVYPICAGLLVVGGLYHFARGSMGALLDPSRRWRREEFQASDAVVVRGQGYRVDRPLEPGEEVPPDAEIVPGGWQHTHCLRCHHTIFAREYGDPWGWTDGSRWLCDACHQEFVVEDALGVRRPG